MLHVIHLVLIDSVSSASIVDAEKRPFSESLLSMNEGVLLDMHRFPMYRPCQ